MDKLFCIFIGGGFGSVMRYLVTQIACKYFSYSFIGTFTVNIIGCFLMGLIMGLVTHKTSIIPQNFKLLLTVGFLGGLTTFSTFSFETLNFIREGKLISGVSYMLLSCLLGLSAAALGFYISTK